MLPVLVAILSLQPGAVPTAQARRAAHLPYPEAAGDALVELEGVRVLGNARAPLAQLLEAARKDGIPIKAAAAFRSVAQQRQIFEAGARKKRVSPQAYTWWTAPPGFSEHHTGLAVDFVEAGNPKADFATEPFRKSATFAWLQAHAARFGFELSFPQGHGLPVAFEPWHWRYVGDEAARAVFARARARKQRP